MSTANRDWNYKTHPFVVCWFHPTGDRLTRYSQTEDKFASYDEAIAALVRPFPTNTSNAHIIRFDGIGVGEMIAKRKRGKPVKILEK